MQIRIPDQAGMILLAVWLIATGLIPLLGLGSSGFATLMSILAIVSGVLLFVRHK